MARTSHVVSVRPIAPGAPPLAWFRTATWPVFSPPLTDLHEDFVEVPPPVAEFHTLDAVLSDLGGEHRAKAMLPEPDRLVTDLDSTLVQQVFDISQGERKPDLEHHRQADDLGRRLEVLERAAVDHPGTLRSRSPHCKRSSPDMTQ